MLVKLGHHGCTISCSRAHYVDVLLSLPCSRCSAECRRHINKCCSPATCARGQAGARQGPSQPAAAAGPSSAQILRPRGCAQTARTCAMHRSRLYVLLATPARGTPAPVAAPHSAATAASCNGGKNACASAYPTCKAGYNGPYGCGASPDLGPHYCCPDGSYGPTPSCNCIKTSQTIISNVGNIGSQPDAKPSNCFGLCGLVSRAYCKQLQPADLIHTQKVIMMGFDGMEHGQRSLTLTHAPCAACSPRGAGWSVE